MYAWRSGVRICSVRCVFTFLLFLLVLQYASPVFAQQESVRRQTVGVVLSGGGARGVAHLGVLRALEEAQVPIDYICGTSMGAIVGGLYAAGYSVDEIEKIFFSEEFQYWLTGKIEEDYIYYYKVKPPVPTGLTVSFDVDNNFSVQLPTSIINPVQMDYAFMEIFSPATEACERDFDSLMIPFFCVASDIEDNKASVRKNGDLGPAVRASMTFPFVFSPIKLDGKIMFDGGMYNNFPSKELLKTYHPDIIIGVKVAGNYPPPVEGNMKSYLENMLTNSSDYNVYCSNSVLIEPNLTGIGVMEFEKMKECDRLGYEAAVAQIPQIREFLIDSVSEKDVAEKRSRFNAKKPNLNVVSMGIKGVTSTQKYYVSSIMHHNNKLMEEDSVLTTKSLKKNYISLYSDGNVHNVQPYLTYNDYYNAYVLNLNVKTKSFLNFDLGGHISTNPTSYLYLGVNYNILHKHAYFFQANAYLGRYYGSWSARARVDFSYSFPLFIETEFNSNKWNYYRLRNKTFSYSPINYLEQSEVNAKINVGFPLGVKDKLVASVGIGKITDDYFGRDYGIIQSDISDRTSFKHIVIGLKEENNSLDDDQFPTQGKYHKLSVQYVNGKETCKPGNTTEVDSPYSADHSWVQFKMLSRFYADITKNFKLGFRGDVFYSFQDLFETYKPSLLNAGVYMPTMETLTQYMPEYRANKYVAFGLENIYALSSLLGINLSARCAAYLYAPVQQIMTDKNEVPYYGEVFEKLYFIASGSIVLRTPIGPLSFIMSYHQRDNDSNPWSISVNFGYLIFNNRNIDK